MDHQEIDHDTEGEELDRSRLTLSNHIPIIHLLTRALPQNHISFSWSNKQELGQASSHPPPRAARRKLLPRLIQVEIYMSSTIVDLPEKSLLCLAVEIISIYSALLIPFI